MDHSENDAPPTVAHPNDAPPTAGLPPAGDVSGVASLEPAAELVGDAPTEAEEPGRGDAAPLNAPPSAHAVSLMDPGRVTTVFTSSAPAAPAPVEPAPPAAPAPDAQALETPAPEVPAVSASPEPPPESPVPDVAPAPPAPSGAAPAEPWGAAPAEPSRAVPAEPPGVAPAEPSRAVPAEPSGVAPAEPSGAAPAEPGATGVATPPASSPAARPTPSPAAIAQAEERKARAQQAWERVVNAHASGESLTGNVTIAVKGGLLVDIAGIRGFLPASQVRVAPGTALETLVRTKVPLKVIDVDTARRRAVVSHRRAVDDERRTKRAELLRSLVVGETREGVVVRLADFGAFVDLGGIDGLIPMRELAFERVEKVQDVLKVGDKLPVVVMRIEEGGKKISLSRKNALPDPWRDHADVLRRDATVHGKVVGKEPRLQVELAPGIVGTVRESDANPADYEIGESIEVAVRSADRATRRITLTTMHGAAAAATQTAATSTGFAPLGVELGRRT